MCCAFKHLLLLGDGGEDDFQRRTFEIVPKRAGGDAYACPPCRARRAGSRGRLSSAVRRPRTRCCTPTPGQTCSDQSTRPRPCCPSRVLLIHCASTSRRKY